MSIEQLKAALPEHAKDLKLNLGAVLNEPALTAQQTWGVALASALATRQAAVIQAVDAEATPKLSAEARTAARTAAAIMAMNNIYYRFTHLVEAPEYAAMPARLRMQGLARHGIEAADFELFALAVSAINGCGMCMASHEKAVLGKGLSREAVQNAVRIAAVIQAVAATLDAEAALAGR